MKLMMWLKLVGIFVLMSVAQNSVFAQSTSASNIIVNIKKDCGAKGDGATNDTIAFKKAARLIEEKGNGTLVIPKGTYIVGIQTHEPGQYPYYKSAPIFSVKNLTGLVIEGNGATIKLADGLRFGAFDKDSGAVYDAPQKYFVDGAYRVGDMPVISIQGSKNVLIRHLEIDGNLSHLILGGHWGDTGRQIAAYGLLLNNNSDVQIDQVSSHHNALDGIAIGYGGLKESDPATPYTLTDCSFEYNGRQGLSWVGGRGVKVYRCKFNHTGKAMNNGTPLHSAPGAGLDIEAENSVTRDGYFEDCEFVDNAGAGMVADSGDGGYSTFKNCTFWGTTNWSIWSKKPGLKFEDCKIYGSAVHAFGSPNPALATHWIRCTFEDKPWTDGKVYRANSGSTLFEVNGNLKNVLLKDCTFIANTCRSIWASATADGRITFDGCTFTHKKADLPDHDFQGLFRFANFIGCHFMENFAKEVTGQWYIQSENDTVASDPPTSVDGPHVKWLNWSSGKTGVLPAKP